jgi:hypothetical protein
MAVTVVRRGSAGGDFGLAFAGGWGQPTRTGAPRPQRSRPSPWLTPAPGLRDVRDEGGGEAADLLVVAILEAPSNITPTFQLPLVAVHHQHQAGDAAGGSTSPGAGVRAIASKPV